jgi:hypothetical protein
MSGDHFNILPPDGPSSEEIELRLNPPPKYEPPPPPPNQRPQFSLSDIMVLMLGVAAGLAGGSWMRADVFAAGLGLLTLMGLVAVHLYPPETHTTRLVWSTLVIAYIMAVVAALLRPGGALPG